MNDRMGDDSVMECVPEGGTVRAHTSWTTGNPNYGVSRENVVRMLWKIGKINTVLSLLRIFARSKTYLLPADSRKLRSCI